MPSTVTVPALGVSSPARIRKIVDLPQPDGPSSDKKLPLSECKVVSCSAVMDWFPSWKVLDSPEMVMPLPRTESSWAAALVELIRYEISPEVLGALRKPQQVVTCRTTELQ